MEEEAADMQVLFEHSERLEVVFDVDQVEEGLEAAEPVEQQQHDDQKIAVEAESVS